MQLRQSWLQCRQQQKQQHCCRQQHQQPHLRVPQWCASRTTAPTRRRVAAVHAAAAPAAAAASAVGSTSAVAAEAGSSKCLELSGIQGKAVGTLLAAMCGNALGAQVEPEKHYRLARMFPDGPHDMTWSFDISSTPLPPGHVSGEFAVLTAVAQSVVRCKAANALDMADAMAASYDPSAPTHWYSPYSQLMLEGLAAGSNPFLLARHAEGYLASTSSRASNTASHRPDRQLHGMSDFSALSRVIPVAVAYREASLQELRQAAEAAVLLTHPSDAVADAAAVLAAAIAWCLRSDPATSSPSQLLEHLLGDVAVGEDMRSKLLLLQDSLPALEGWGGIDSWTQFWQSKAWSDVAGVANLLTKQNLAVEAPQAAALALWVVLVSWQHPQQAVMLAVSLGGYAATTGTLVGAMAGALHGCRWVPEAWWDNLQEEPQPAAAGDAAGGQQSSDSSLQVQPEQQQAADALPQEAPGRVEAAPAEEEEEEAADSEWMLRPVSKWSVVTLGHQLAELDCRASTLAGL